MHFRELIYSRVNQSQLNMIYGHFLILDQRRKLQGCHPVFIGHISSTIVLTYTLPWKRPLVLPKIFVFSREKIFPPPHPHTFPLYFSLLTACYITSSLDRQITLFWNLSSIYFLWGIDLALVSILDTFSRNHYRWAKIPIHL